MIKRRIKSLVVIVAIIAALISTVIYGEGWWTNLFKFWVWFMLFAHVVLLLSENLQKTVQEQGRVYLAWFSNLTTISVVTILMGMGWFGYGTMWLFCWAVTNTYINKKTSGDRDSTDD